MLPEELRTFIFAIPIASIADVIKRASACSVDERIRRFDDVAAKQGAVMGAAIQLGSLGVPMPLVDHALTVLLVLCECFESQAPDVLSIKPHVVQATFD